MTSVLPHFSSSISFPEIPLKLPSNSLYDIMSIPPPPAQSLPPLSKPLRSAVQTQLQESASAVEKKRKLIDQVSRPNLDEDDTDSDYEDENDSVFSKNVPTLDGNYDFSKFSATDVDYDDKTEKYIIYSKDLMEIEKRLCEGIILYPTSQRLHGKLLYFVVRASIARRVQKLASCQSRLQQGFATYLYSLHYLNISDARFLRRYIGDRDPSLVSCFDNAVDQVRSVLATKTADEIVALMINQAEINYNSLVTKTDEKLKKEVVRVRKAAEKLSIVSMSTASTSNDNNSIEKLNDPKIECVVCFDARRQICFDPCGHITVCQVCSISLQQCPVCMKKIEKRIKFIVS